jgi:D-alanyl-lipoteichoic acid acyltransferase DltB (MBOAT superfamily)
MVFNSIPFLIFLIVVFALHWFVLKKNHRLQSLMLLVASCIFYMFLIPEYILILFTTILIDYYAGIQIAKSEGRARKRWLIASIISTCLVLFVFKYCDFFIGNVSHVASVLGWNLPVKTLGIILPIGLSFHTFQSLSYVIEVYRRQQEPEKDFLIYSLYVMYFPQLVAGPIERAANLLPQFHQHKPFNATLAAEGLYQILYGMFKKVVIADTCAIYANEAFNHQQDFGGLSLFLGTVYFAFQIYGDFSGYSDIALGTSKLFGIRLMTNFRFPYFSRDIAEFWRRWHISLSTWFRDYVYFPLGGSRVSGYRKFRNVLVIFLVSGFWHGANWTFIIWGAMHACFYIPILYIGRNRSHINDAGEGRRFPSLKEIAQMSITFILVCIAFIFFRASNVGEGFSYLSGIFARISDLKGVTRFLPGFLLVVPFIWIEWMNRRNHHPRLFIQYKIPGWVRIALETVIAVLIIESFYTLNHEQFIYFQF